MKIRISKDIVEIGNVIFVMNAYERACIVILTIAGIYLLLTGF